MNYIEPIRDRKKIAQIKNLLRGQRRYRDLLLFVVGINTALRISDLLQLKVGQFLDDNGNIRGRFWIKEQKRGKRQEVAINRSIREALGDYLTAYPHMAKEPDRFLFFNPYTDQPIKRGQAWKFITAICHEVGLRWAYQVYEDHGHVPEPSYGDGLQWLFTSGSSAD